MVETRLANVLVWQLHVPLHRLVETGATSASFQAELRDMQSGTEYNTANATGHLHECRLAFASGPGQVAALQGPSS